MSWTWIDPEYEEDLRSLGLEHAGDFLALQGVILCGHPDRHVRRVELIRESGAPIVAYLKKEHRVRFRDRLAGVWAGCGWVSKSVREGKVLQAARTAGIGCPRVLAYGEDAGQAFLLIENLDMADLRKYAKAFPRQRRKVSKAIGREIARLHAAGFRHPELYAKHVLLRQENDGYRFAFLDWQLAKQVRRLSFQQRCRDLASLHATLADELASPDDRLACLREYRKNAGVELPNILQMARTVEGMAASLLSKRRIRELRQLPLPHLAQNLIWVDGEALTMTLDFWKETGGQAPAWLHMPLPPARLPALEEVIIPQDNRELRLTRRWFTPSLLRSLPGARKTGFPSPEFEQVGALIRLQRFGLRGPRLLAVGHRDLPSGGKYSFLLVEPSEEARPLEEAPDVDMQPWFPALLGRFLRQMHEAGYGLKQSPFRPTAQWGVMGEDEDEGELVFLRLEGIQRSKLPAEQRLLQDLHWVGHEAPLHWTENALTELVRTYVGRQRWTAEAAALLGMLSEALPPGERQVVG
ncbi:MAG: lipopolysaccharide kinase InaA family protein [Gemmataceae bacterium]